MKLDCNLERGPDYVKLDKADYSFINLLTVLNFEWHEIDLRLKKNS